MQAEYSPVNVPNSFVNLTIPGYAQKSPNPWNTAIGVAYEIMTKVARIMNLIKKIIYYFAYVNIIIFITNNFIKKIIWDYWGSNPGHYDLQSYALPTELWSQH